MHRRVTNGHVPRTVIGFQKPLWAQEIHSSPLHKLLTNTELAGFATHLIFISMATSCAEAHIHCTYLSSDLQSSAHLYGESAAGVSVPNWKYTSLKLSLAIAHWSSLLLENSPNILSNKAPLHLTEAKDKTQRFSGRLRGTILWRFFLCLCSCFFRISQLQRLWMRH